MMKLVVFVIFFSLASYAENSQFFRCRISNSEWNAIFMLDAIGSGLLQFQKLPAETVHSCSMGLINITDKQRGVVPQLRISLSRLDCEPDAPLIKSDLFEEFSVIIDVSEREKPKSIVQWLRKKQVDKCQVEKLSTADISFNVQKWREGRWGRRTASDPKKLKTNLLKGK